MNCHDANASRLGDADSPFRTRKPTLGHAFDDGSGDSMRDRRGPDELHGFRRWPLRDACELREGREGPLPQVHGLESLGRDSDIAQGLVAITVDLHGIGMLTAVQFDNMSTEFWVCTRKSTRRASRSFAISAPIGAWG